MNGWQFAFDLFYKGVVILASVAGVGYLARMFLLAGRYQERVDAITKHISLIDKEMGSHGTMLQQMTNNLSWIQGYIESKWGRYDKKG